MSMYRAWPARFVTTRVTRDAPSARKLTGKMPRSRRWRGETRELSARDARVHEKLQ